MGQTTSCSCGSCHERSTISEDACQTNLKVLNFEYSWTIRNFSTHTDVLESPVFCTGGKNKAQWKLRTNPGIGAGLSPWIYIYIVLVSSPKLPVSVKYAHSIITAEMQKCCTKSSGYSVYKDIGSSFGWCKFVHRSDIVAFPFSRLPNDELTVLCEMSVIDEIINVSRYSTNIPNIPANLPNCRMTEDLNRLIVTQTFCDVVFNVHGKLIEAHRAILAARSPVFMTMFEAGMGESVSGHVIVDDIECEVFEDMLHYIYTGEAKNVNDLAEGLLAAADRYDLKRLKAQAEAALCKTLDIENVAKMMITADLYRAECLRKHALDFIGIHMDAVSKNSAFQRIAISHPLLMTDTVHALTKARGIPIDSNEEEGILHRVLPFSFKYPSLHILYCLGLIIGMIFSQDAA